MSQRTACWLPPPWASFTRGYSSSHRPDPAGEFEAPRGTSGLHSAADDHQRHQLQSMLLGSFTQDPRGTSELLARTLDGPTQRVVMAAFAEQPSLSRQRLVPPEVMRQELAGSPAADPAPPSFSQLVAVAVTKGLPFVAFGFFDNLIMITAGDQIDTLLGAKLNLSSMAAAGLGNTVADVVGINISHSIENYFKRAGGMSPALTKAQWAMPVTNRAKWLGCAVGMATGCLLGLTPLLITRTDPEEQGKQRLGTSPAGAAAAAAPS